MTKRILLLLLVFSFFLCGCESTLTTEELFQSKVNNEIALNDVLTRQYDKADLERSFNDFLSSRQKFFNDQEELEKLHQQFPIEVIRTADISVAKEENSWYTVYQTKENGRFFVFYARLVLGIESPHTPGDGEISVLHYVYSKTPLDSTALDEINIGDMANDILQIDEDAVLQPRSVGSVKYCSMHLLKDGRIIEIDYDAEKRVIEKYNYYYSILPQDVPQ